MNGFRFDVKTAFRALRRSPAFTATAILMLMLGIGGTTAIFSVLNGVLLEPLPYRSSDDLVAIWQTAPGIGEERFPISPATYFTYRDAPGVLEAVGMWDNARVTVTGSENPRRVDVAVVTHEVFPLMRASAVLGRQFTARDMSAEAPTTVMLAHRYWQGRLGGDSSVIGTTLEVDREPVEVIGVMPAGFRFPDYEPELYFPAQFDLEDVYVGYYSFRGIGRLRPGATIEEANAEASRVIPAAILRYGGTTVAEAESMELGTSVTPLKQDVVGDIGPILWVLFGAVGIVLLIACANVANLFLVRAERRNREVLVRAALGASGGRLVRLFLTESLLLGILGGVMGLWLAYAGLPPLLRVAPDNLPRADQITIDPKVVAFTLAVSAVAGLLFGLAPWIGRRRPGTRGNLKDAGRGMSDGHARQKIRSMLAMGEIALALVLLIGAGLMIRTYRALRAVEPGFERPEEVVTARVWIPDFEIEDPVSVASAHQRLLDRLSAIPGVESAGAAASLAMDGWVHVNRIHVRERPLPEEQAVPMRRINWVAGDYFATLETPLMAGRAIDWDDIRNGRSVAIVSRAFANEYWDDPARAVGASISFQRDGPWQEIVGVVGDIRAEGVDLDPPAMVYVPLMTHDLYAGRTFAQRDMGYALRVRGGNERAVFSAIRDAVREVNPNLLLSRVGTLDEIVARSMARTSFVLTLLAIAASVAVLLGLVGVYGVLAFVVALRRREFGIRMALGARAEDVMRLIVRRGLVVATGGVIIGLAAAVAVTRLISSLLFGVQPLDPLTFGAVSIVLVAVALLASYLPARKATRVDPAGVMRSE
jgi:putative ABC transport system permease protein